MMRTPRPGRAGQLLIVLSIGLTAIFQSEPGSGQATDKQILLVRDVAKDLCAAPANYGYRRSATGVVVGKVDVAVLVKRLAKLGLTAKANVSKQEWSGVLQQQLAANLVDYRRCTQNVFKTLMQNFTAASGKTIINQRILLNVPREVKKPDIVLVRTKIDYVERDDVRYPKITLDLKNNGTRTAVLLNGVVKNIASATMTDCNEPRYSLMKSDWEYQADIEQGGKFEGKHALAPNETETFDITVGRTGGGPGLTVYKAMVALNFDEGRDLSSPVMYLEIIGPSVPVASYVAGVSEEQWSKCMIDLVKKFAAIGYDLKPRIDPNSLTMMRKYGSF